MKPTMTMHEFVRELVDTLEIEPDAEEWILYHLHGLIAKERKAAVDAYIDSLWAEDVDE